MKARIFNIEEIHYYYYLIQMCFYGDRCINFGSIKAIQVIKTFDYS